MFTEVIFRKSSTKRTNLIFQCYKEQSEKAIKIATEGYYSILFIYLSDTETSLKTCKNNLSLNLTIAIVIVSKVKKCLSFIFIPTARIW